jgi:hypothetical protein
MISLKAFLPVLSKHTDLSVTALYERQRALVRLGLYPAPTQSGRNSGGAMATPGNVGIMLLSVLVTDRLSEVDERMFDYLALKPHSDYEEFRGAANPDCCIFTGQRNLYRGLQALIRGGPDLDVVDISVDRKRRIVEFESADPDVWETVTFGEATERPKLKHLVRYDGTFQLSCDLWECNEPPERRTYNPWEMD